METILNFAGTVLSSLFWPLCIFLIALMFRENIRSILGRITSADFNGFSVTISEQRDLREKIVQGANIQNIGISSGKESALIEEIAETSSSAAIIYAYSQLENAMKKKLLKTDPSANNYPVNEYPRILLKHKVVNKEVFEALDEIRKIRNSVVRYNLQVDSEAAKVYGKNAELLINIIGGETHQ